MAAGCGDHICICMYMYVCMGGSPPPFFGFFRLSCHVGGWMLPPGLEAYGIVPYRTKRGITTWHMQRMLGSNRV